MYLVVYGLALNNRKFLTGWFKTGCSDKNVIGTRRQVECESSSFIRCQNFIFGNADVLFHAAYSR